jgi:hypothetical protein
VGGGLLGFAWVVGRRDDRHPGAGVPPPEAPSGKRVPAAGRSFCFSALCCWSRQPGAFLCRRAAGGASAGAGPEA